MLRLMLLRHGKSSWKEPGIADRDRPLAGRGRQAVPLVGRHAKAMGLVPDLILTSPARRARETAELFAAEVGGVKIEAVEDLYDFGDGRRLLEVIRTRGRTSRTLMLVGHNPAIESLARLLAGSGNEDTLAELAGKFPTAALAVIGFAAADWQAVRPGSGKLVHFIRPKALEGTG